MKLLNCKKNYFLRNESFMKINWLKLRNTMKPFALKFSPSKKKFANKKFKKKKKDESLLKLVVLLKKNKEKKTKSEDKRKLNKDQNLGLMTLLNHLLHLVFELGEVKLLVNLLLLVLVVLLGVKLRELARMEFPLAHVPLLSQFLVNLNLVVVQDLLGEVTAVLENVIQLHEVLAIPVLVIPIPVAIVQDKMPENGVAVIQVEVVVLVIRNVITAVVEAILLLNFLLAIQEEIEVLTEAIEVPTEAIEDLLMVEDLVILVAGGLAVVVEAVFLLDILLVIEILILKVIEAVPLDLNIHQIPGEEDLLVVGEESNYFEFCSFKLLFALSI
mmetsp:Transcript_67821/g.102285  ORF Transcript_67821/g.102285 Transcript_67821/m.102285 type:complete len:329 (-) Transcript_67821:40-1026(-)